MRKCKDCDIDFPNKKWGYVNLCEDCDIPERVNKSMAILIADGKTDYHFKVVSNPSAKEAAAIRAAGMAHDPRSQLKAINKVPS